jgi:hypothetical protein
MTQTRIGVAGTHATTTAALPAVTGLAAIGMAIYQVATPGTPDASFDSVGDWAREILFLTYLLGAIAALAAAVDDWAARVPARVVQVGYGLIAIGAAIGMALREDPDWFFALAGPGLLLSTIGFLWLAIDAVRCRRLPLWAGALLGVGGAVAIIMSELGTSVLVGAFWLYAAQRARQG